MGGGVSGGYICPRSFCESKHAKPTQAGSDKTVNSRGNTAVKWTVMQTHGVWASTGQQQSLVVHPNPSRFEQHEHISPVLSLIDRFRR